MKRRRITDERICHIIGSTMSLETANRITPSMDLRRDVGIDSVGLMSIVYVLEEQTGMDAFSHVDEFIVAQYVSDIIAIVRQG